MLIAIVAVLALVAGTLTGLAAFGLALAVMVNEVSRRQVDVMKQEVIVQSQLLEISERRAGIAEAKASAVTQAIEGNSLPWYPKNDKLEARYENEAIDRLENPSFYDSIDGLGGTR